MAKYRVDVSGPAENAPRNIVRYISLQLSAPETALKMLESIEEAISKLYGTPKIHPLVNDDRLSQLGYRKLIVKNYIVFYKVDETNMVVDVERVLHARRGVFKIRIEL
jgi:addiction module RelE/StbE family toxin